MEIWKDIKGFENYYQVSNYGNVRSLKRIRKNGKNSFYVQKGKILTPGIQNTGYEFVVLNKSGIRKGCKVHRLVAETFIPNPNNYPCVNHKDENRKNNNVDNLEWCTIAYNNNYGTKIDRYRKKMQKEHGRRIIQYDMEGNLLNKWNCIMDAERYIGKKRASTPIWSCCQNKAKTAYGYKWEYEN